MSNADSLPSQVRSDLMRYLARDIGSKEEFTDKVRIVVILILTSNEKKLITEAIETLKVSQEPSKQEGQQKTIYLDKATEQLFETLLKFRGNIQGSDGQSSAA